MNSALQTNQNEWHIKFSNLEKDFSKYKTTKDQVNILRLKLKLLFYVKNI